MCPDWGGSAVHRQRCFKSPAAEAFDVAGRHDTAVLIESDGLV
jgi:hypothetical protein